MDQSISQLFHQVQSAALEPSLPSSELQQVIDSSVRLEFAISQAALFSRNETVREVDTDHLPFMLTAYYMAVLHLQRQENRKNALETAEGCLDRFLTLMEEYQVLTQEQKLIWKEGKYHNPRREDAIAWLKQKKAVENALEILRRREDEDGLREFHMMRMQHCIQESFSHLKFCKLEMEMLQMKEQGPLPRPPPSQGLQYVRIDVKLHVGKQCAYYAECHLLLSTTRAGTGTNQGEGLHPLLSYADFDCGGVRGN